MVELRFKSTGTDAVYIGNSNIFLTALFTLSIFKNGWRADKLGSQDELQENQNWLRLNYEGGLTGNRIQIAARAAARRALSEKIQMILYYVGMFAEEHDIATLVSTGVVSRKIRTRARRSAKSA